MMNGCQTCLRVIKHTSEGFYIDCASTEPDEVSLKDKLMDCVPELLLESTQNVMLCHSCVASLTSAYEFKQRCLEAQQKIYGYLQQMPLNTEINVGEIALYYKRLEIVAEDGKPVVVKYNPNEELDKQISTAIATHGEKMAHNCGWCKFSCVDKCTFRQHVILHYAKKAPYKCDECKLTLPTPELLLDHLATHTGEKPYSCTLCEFLASTHVELKEHGWTHRKPFQCSICWLRFAQQSELQTHSEIHNALQHQDFECHVINDPTQTNTTLQRQDSESHVNDGHVQTNTTLQCQYSECHLNNDHTQTDTSTIQTNSLVTTINENTAEKTVEPVIHTATQQAQVQLQPQTWVKTEVPKTRRGRVRTNRKFKVLVAPNTFMRMRVDEAIRLGFCHQKKL